MGDSIRDGTVRQVYDSGSNTAYKVTIPTGWVESHQNQLDLTGGYSWGDLYSGTPSNLPDLPENIKEQFGLNAPPAVPVQGRAREDVDMDIGGRRRRDGEIQKTFHPSPSFIQGSQVP